MSLSTAIESERLERVSGYKIKKGNFDNETPNLQQIIAVFGEANIANQGSLSIVKKEITTAQEAAEEYGYGSPIHQQMRILRPISGDGVGGIPTIVFPQISDVSATPTVHQWTIIGTATKNTTHSGVINGRRSLDLKNYSYSIVIGDTEEIIAAKIADSINSVLSSPVSATSTGNIVEITTKWAGQTSANLVTNFDLGTESANLSYSLNSVVNGGGSIELDTALNQFGETWYNTVLNPYGTNSVILDTLEAFNGFPDDENPTGQYSGRIFRPFLAFCGTTLDDKDDLSAITDAEARIKQITNVFCTAPKSSAFPSEVSANAVAVYSRIAQDNPELDVNGKSYPDCPVPDDSVIGDMSIYNNRDFLLKNGCSTVTLENGAYKIQSLVTSYHPEGESPLQYNYTRNLNLDHNIKEGIAILESLNVKDHVLLLDGQSSDAAKSVKPKQWKAVLYDYLDDLGSKALINEPDFSKESLKVEIDSNNPNRFNTFFRYKRTGVARIQSTDVEAGF